MRAGQPSSTARSVAAARAWLTDAGVLDDPYAARFAGGPLRFFRKALEIGPAAPYHRGLVAYIAARTRFYDALVRAGTDAGATQVVLLAAGYDCRAWRLARDGVRFFEVDHPDTQADKRRQLASNGADNGPTYIPADLATTPLDGVLFPAGFNPAVPTVFCCEGLTMYLTEQAVTDLLKAAARIAAPGSRLGVDFGLAHDDTQTPDLLLRVVRGVTRLQGEPRTFTTRPDDAGDLIVRSGWGVDEIVLGPDLVERFVEDGEIAAGRSWSGSFVASATVRH